MIEEEVEKTEEIAEPTPKRQRKPKKEKVAMLQYATGKYKKLLKLVSERHRAIAEKQGMTYFAWTEADVQNEDGRPVQWNRILAIQKLFAQGFDVVLYIDADCVILRDDISLMSAITEDDMFALVEYPQNRHYETHLNTGVMWVRKCNFMESFLNLWWSYDQHELDWFEQRALMNLLEVYVEPYEATTRLPLRWNRIWLETATEEDVILGLHGYFTWRERHELMKRVIAQYPIGDKN